MSRPPLEVADILRAHAGDLLQAPNGGVSPAQQSVIRNLVACRTAALGGYGYECSLRCGYQHFAYKPCGNRHCPKCQAAASAQWVEARAEDLLPVEYFHVVFTMPPRIAEMALQNKKVIYDLLFQASAKALQKIALDPHHLGAKLGFIGLLHTWGQRLHFHPHVHYVVPGGGPSPDGSRWISSRTGFLLPVRVLRRLYRGKFLSLLRKAFAAGKLSFQGRLASLNAPKAFAAHLESAYDAEWVVYAKPPFGGAAPVLKYLARYTHRVAIANQRLVSFDDGLVRFRWKDYAHGNRTRIETLSAVEFIRRFLLHVLPKGFMRIRHFGFLANAVRAKQLPRCRELLRASDAELSASEDDVRSVADLIAAYARIDPLETTGDPCPQCGQGHLVRRTLDPDPSFDPFLPPPAIDSS